MGGDVGGEQAASWNPCDSEPHLDSWPHPQGPSQQEDEQSSASVSYSYGDNGETQYRYPPPPPPSSYGIDAFFGFEDPNAQQYQIQYGGHMTRGNTDEDEDNDVIPGRHSLWY